MMIVLFVVLSLCACARPGQTPVAVVNGEAIGAAELIALLPGSADTTPHGDSIKRQVLDQLIDKRLFVAEAIRQGLDTRIATQLELDQKGIVTQQLYDRITEAGNRLSDMEVQSAYRLLQTEVHTRMIAVKQETTARRIVRELDAGVPFETLASRNSVHPSARNGGDLSFTPVLYVDEPMRSTVMALAPGKHSAPLFFDNTWQIAQLVESRPTDPPPPPLTEIRRQLETRLKQQRRREIANKYLADLRSRIEFNPVGMDIMCKPVDSITEQDKEVPVAVKDKGKYVKVGRLLHVASRFPASLDTAMRKYSVRREVEEDIMYQDALDQKLDELPEVRVQLAERRDNLLYKTLYRKEVTDKLNITEQDIQNYYQQHRDRFVENDPARAAPMIRNRLLTEGRDSLYKAYATALRAGAKTTVNEAVLRKLRREAPARKGIEGPKGPGAR